MKLAAYLDRIGLSGAVRPDLETLKRVHLAHQITVPFENLDVQLRRPVSLDPLASLEKIVGRRRGGWCYEMNGVMGWALEQMGFNVQRISAGVMRETLGDAPLGNHLCLLVTLDVPHLVDVGFGGSLAEPMPLRIHQRQDHPYQVALVETADGYWRFSEAAHGDPVSFDFKTAPADEALFGRVSKDLWSNPSSSFVQNLVVQRRSIDTHTTLRGRVLTRMDSAHKKKRMLHSAEEFTTVLREQFALDLPEAVSLWPGICARHDALFPANPDERA